MYQLDCVYMPHRTYRLLSQMYLVVLESLAYYVYLKSIQNIKHRNNQWLIYTHSAYYDLCVSRWCMLFGSEKNEPTHFIHLFTKKNKLIKILKEEPFSLASREDLKAYLLSKAKIKHSVFYKFRGDTIKYRNKNLIHREHDPDFVKEKSMHRPLTFNIMKSSFALFDLINQIAQTFPSEESKENKHKLILYKFKTMSDLRKYLNRFFLKCPAVKSLFL